MDYKYRGQEDVFERLKGLAVRIGCVFTKLDDNGEEKPETYVYSDGRNLLRYSPKREFYAEAVQLVRNGEVVFDAALTGCDGDKPITIFYMDSNIQCNQLVKWSRRRRGSLPVELGDEVFDKVSLERQYKFKEQTS